MSDSPDFERLSRLLAGDLTPEQAATVEHLKTIGGEIDPASVQSMSELARRLFADYIRQRQHPDAHLGVRVFDSQVMPLPEGVRPAGVDTRRLRYRLDDLTLELSLYPLTPESHEMIGQIEGVDRTGALTIRLEQGRRRRTTRADRFGLFRFERVEAGSGRLIIESDTGVVGCIYLDV